MKLVRCTNNGCWFLLYSRNLLNRIPIPSFLKDKMQCQSSLYIPYTACKGFHGLQIDLPRQGIHRDERQFNLLIQIPRWKFKMQRIYLLIILRHIFIYVRRLRLEGWSQGAMEEEGEKLALNLLILRQLSRPLLLIGCRHSSRIVWAMVAEAHLQHSIRASRCGSEVLVSRLPGTRGMFWDQLPTGIYLVLKKKVSFFHTFIHIVGW